ncbi:SAM-dependent methyltransferase [Kitasatospora kifunensis]|uniref:Sarcosine/dimethylglycine N-methyltransferase n=1 Tax=Kitasatospora kifunensis TaxID=58351 RepID=A0A7W7R987_KITKI|nr:class I SAM-dependent methyltransferase [Kitasatospora kifunensis]MBB4927753.1 sarcosine/dimethylglycine N-methyltransferase [Kitasatospora kifunensis]
MPADTPASATEAARRYYETGDVDGFYAVVWGGENIHTGIYTHDHESIATASRRTVERLADKSATHLGPKRTVLDLGSGYGGAARYLAGRFGCQVVALNISETQNRRHHETNLECGLADLITVTTGSFQDVPYPDSSFDLVWSQEALCHSGDRPQALAEAARVLKPDGQLIFTDLMAADDAPAEALRPVAARLGIGSFATPGFYHAQAARLGFNHVHFEDLSAHLLTHYLRLAEETARQAEELTEAVSPAYLDKLHDNLPRWIEACRNGRLRWGIYSCHR